MPPTDVKRAMPLVRRRGRGLRRAALLLLSVALTGPADGPAAAKRDKAPAPVPDWIRVDYGELLERRTIGHSGESVDMLLRRLAGRSLPGPGVRAGDVRAIHSLLAPLVEPYAFVMPDALDALSPVDGPPLLEIGSLWRPGEAQPAWVELLRSRRFVVEGDGQGRLRVCLPWTGDGGADPEEPREDSGTAAEVAWKRAWPVLRHVLAAELTRLSDVAGDAAEAPVLRVEVHAYRHFPERSTFLLGARGREFTVDDTRGEGLRPPLPLERFRSFAESGLRLEGAKLEPGGTLRLLGSRNPEGSTLLQRPLDLSDFAVAYRAVFHGGAAEPYMSLDRGFSPQTSSVNYGGRLRDTALGLVSLLCDIRFKTFSLGLDITTGEDLRQRIRQRLPEMRTHLERFAAHPDSATVGGQQTRLWFYPDKVDLTLSPQGDVLVLRRVRMSAASERLDETGLSAGRAGDPPWTRATIDAINRHYGALSGLFPELGDLDQVVRLLSLFTWLKQAQADGFLLPDLDGLLTLELPALYTPRTFPQLLAYNALPAPDSSAPAEVFDRLPVAEALDRLDPASRRPLPARRRYERAVAALNPAQPDHAALLAEFRRVDVEGLDDSSLDLLIYRAERLRMHRRVLATLGGPERGIVEGRRRAGERLRVFSLGIGGLDLDMGQVLDRARGESLGLVAPDAAESPPTGGSPGGGGTSPTPNPDWRDPPRGMVAARVPDYGLDRDARGGPASRSDGGHLVEVGSAAPDTPESGRSWVLVVLDEDGPEVRSRKLTLDAAGRAEQVERVEASRILRYAFERRGATVVAKASEPDLPPSAGPPAPSGGLPDSLALLEVLSTPSAVVEPRTVTLRIAAPLGGGASRSLEAGFPRQLLQRLVLGREVDLTPQQPLSGFSPLPGALRGVSTVMVVPEPSWWRPPWQGSLPPTPGEEEPLRLARALKSWWSSEVGQPPRAVVGVAPGLSADRWAVAPRLEGAGLLLLPDDGFPEPFAGMRDALASSWPSEAVVATLPESTVPTLVVLVSAEPPASFAARLRRLARDPALQGKLLAAWCLSGPVRQDLPASLLGEGNLAGLGLGEGSVIGTRRAAQWIGEIGRAVAAGGAPPRRAEELPGPFLWYF